MPSFQDAPWQFPRTDLLTWEPEPKARVLARKIYETDPAFQQLVYPGPCSYCHGDGDIYGKRCEQCDGDGHARQFKPPWEFLEPTTQELFVAEAARALYPEKA